ncbi:cytochrome P450 [Profundibacterium mesophilum]|nr:cytochrome P450 [Profundibacterium mesophilum]
MRYLRLFRRDILSAQPARLYRAWMAEFRTPFFTSFLVNDPALVRLVLRERPQDFPKSDRVGEGLRQLLGRSVFLTNGEEWERQRRIINPAFEGGRLRGAFPAMQAAGQAAAARLQAGEVEIEAATSHAAADVIFRTLFSMPIEDRVARRVFDAFGQFQRKQPILTPAAFVPLPRWLPRVPRRGTGRPARVIRRLITELTDERARQIEAGSAPDDLATKIMTTADPLTGRRLAPAEMVDQVAIFFLAGHETSASALAWALYLLACDPQAQARAACEAKAFQAAPDMSSLPQLRYVRAVFREALRLYPPVPMMVREARGRELFRGRTVPRGAQIVLSPWHLHRHERFHDDPDGFDPDRPAGPPDCFLPFSAGPRVCPGAGFAMMEGTVLLAALLARWRFEPVKDAVPVPVAHLTVRSRTGIRLRLRPRGGDDGADGEGGATGNGGTEAGSGGKGGARAREAGPL